MKETEMFGLTCEAKGHVTIDYTDSLTGKVKERVQGENHVFKQGIMSSIWNSMFFTSKGPYLILTDWANPVNYSLPVIPGNIIGRAYYASAASGLYQGGERTEERIQYQLSGSTRTYKAVYDWLPNQIPGPIKCIGYSYQGNMASTEFKYNNRVGASLYQPILRDSFSGSTIDWFFCTSSGRRYSLSGSVSISAAGSVNIFDTTTGTSTGWVALQPLVDSRPNFSAGGYVMWGIDPQTEHAWAILPWRNTTDVHYWDVYCFNKDVTSTLMSYRIQVPQYNVNLDGKTNSVFVVKNGIFYVQYLNNVYGYNIIGNPVISDLNDVRTNYGYLTAFEFSTTGASNRIVVCGNGVVSFLYNTESQFKQTPSQLFDLNNNILYAAYTGRSSPSGWTSVPNVFPPTAFTTNNGTMLLGYSMFSSGYVGFDPEYAGFSNIGAVTCYQVPPGAPERPEGTGVTISYELEVTF